MVDADDGVDMRLYIDANKHVVDAMVHAVDANEHLDVNDRPCMQTSVFSAHE